MLVQVDPPPEVVLGGARKPAGTATGLIRTPSATSNSLSTGPMTATPLISTSRKPNMYLGKLRPPAVDAAFRSWRVWDVDDVKAHEDRIVRHLARRRELGERP